MERWSYRRTKSKEHAAASRLRPSPQEGLRPSLTGNASPFVAQKYFTRQNEAGGPSATAADSNPEGAVSLIGLHKNWRAISTLDSSQKALVFERLDDAPCARKHGCGCNSLSMQKS